MESLCALALGMDPFKVEQCVCLTLKNRLVTARINHQGGIIHFNSHHLESKQLRGHLTQLGTTLREAASRIAPDEELATTRARCQLLAKQNASRENQALLGRKHEIERLKEVEELVKARKVRSL